MNKKFEPAPPDPGIKPGGIRERALWAAQRGPQLEDEEKTKASQAHWAAYRAEQAKRKAALILEKRKPRPTRPEKCKPIP